MVRCHREREATVQEGRARIETIFNAMLDHYNAMVRVSWFTTWNTGSFS